MKISINQSILTHCIEFVSFFLQMSSLLLSELIVLWLISRNIACILVLFWIYAMLLFYIITLIPNTSVKNILFVCFSLCFLYFDGYFFATFVKFLWSSVSFIFFSFNHTIFTLSTVSIYCFLHVNTYIFFHIFF